MDALVLAQEEACDADTTRSFSPVRIAETLLKVERLRTGLMPGPMAANFTGSPLESRVRALLEPDYETASRSLARLVLITGSTAIALLLSLELHFGSFVMAHAAEEGMTSEPASVFNSKELVDLMPYLICSTVDPSRC